MSDVTQILEAIREGQPGANDQLLPTVYEELRRMARSHMAREPLGHTLQPTALVHEAWLRLVIPPKQSWQNRAHFFAAAAEAMRRILIARARRKQAMRHGAGAEHVDIDDLPLASPGPEDQLLAVHDALDRLTDVDGDTAELVKLRYFVGLSIPESAAILRISEATAKRRWAYARAWLFSELQGKNPPTPPPA